MSEKKEFDLTPTAEGYAIVSFPALADDPIRDAHLAAMATNASLDQHLITLDGIRRTLMKLDAIILRDGIDTHVKMNRPTWLRLKRLLDISDNKPWPANEILPHPFDGIVYLEDQFAQDGYIQLGKFKKSQIDGAEEFEVRVTCYIGAE